MIHDPRTCLDCRSVRPCAQLDAWRDACLRQAADYAARMLADIIAALREARRERDEARAGLAVKLAGETARADAAEADVRELRNDWRRGLRRAHELTLETQTMEDAVTDLCRIVLQEREQKHAAEAEVAALRAVLSGAGFRVAPALHGEPALWCRECARDSGYHWAQCSKVSPAPRGGWGGGRDGVVLRGAVGR